MVFHRKFLYGGQQENYFHVKILILVCPNRTCKNFENRRTVFMAKMNFEQGLCIGKGNMIMKMHSFRNFYLISSQVCHCCHFVMILSNHYKYRAFKIFAGKYLSPLHEIFVQEIPVQKCFWPEPFYLSTDFQTFCCTFCDKLDA